MQRLPTLMGRQRWLCSSITFRKSCTNQQQARWSYIAQEHTKAAMANPQTVIPWYSDASAEWPFGTALGNADSKPQHNMANSSTLWRTEGV